MFFSTTFLWNILLKSKWEQITFFMNKTYVLGCPALLPFPLTENSTTTRHTLRCSSHLKISASKMMKETYRVLIFTPPGGRNFVYSRIIITTNTSSWTRKQIMNNSNWNTNFYLFLCPKYHHGCRQEWGSLWLMYM